MGSQPTGLLHVQASGRLWTLPKTLIKSERVRGDGHTVRVMDEKGGDTARVPATPLPAPAALAVPAAPGVPAAPAAMARVKKVARKTWPYAAGLVAVMGVLGGVFRHQLSWSDVPTWILGSVSSRRARHALSTCPRPSAVSRRRSVTGSSSSLSISPMPMADGGTGTSEPRCCVDSRR